MTGVFFDKRAMVVLVLIGIIGAVVGFWELQAARMKGDFAAALRAGEVGGIPIVLREKQWTDADLSTLRVTKLSASQGPQQALVRMLHSRGGYTLSGGRYAYQAAITDSDTGIRHLFGYQRNGSGGWRYVSIHPGSAAQAVEQRVENIEAYQESVRRPLTESKSGHTR